MTVIKIINTLEIIENIVGVHRNFSLLKESIRPVVRLRILTEICAIIIVFTYLFYNVCTLLSVHDTETFDYVFELYYLCFETVNSLVAIILSYCFRNNFNEFFLNITKVQQLYEADPLYKDLAKKQCKRFYFDVTILNVAFIFITFIYVYDWIGEVELTVLATVDFITRTIHQYRFFCESLSFLQFIEIVVFFLKYINFSVKEAIEKLGEDFEVENEPDLRKIRSELVKWGEGSQQLVIASNCLYDCFGSQITFALISVTIYYIILLYNSVSYLKIMFFQPLIWSTVCSLISYTVIKMLVISAGQRAQNQATTLNRNLAHLHNIVVGIPGAEATECARAVAVLARRLRAAPLRVRLLSSRPVQMALLADILTVVANYSILLLQFNHVL